MLDLFSPVHIIILLIIALLVFGPKRLPEIGSGLGKSIREFKQAMNGVMEDAPQTKAPPAGTEYPAQVVATDDKTQQQ
ncbi:MAG: twin-arginine translocase TatA/TatE family subunit [Firmicutes bacterium]|nr:twin-arginine translocase TatA/TatE family subunit [Bacillota bacterium]